MTGEHLSNKVWRLQLSDSAVLDGTTAYSLKDGQELWSFTENYGYTGYSGPAGHECFIEKVDSKQRSGPFTGARITLTSDSTVRITPKRVDVALSAGFNEIPVLVNGWTIQPKNPDDALRTGEGESWEAQAVSLDSLLGSGDEEPVDLGRITDVDHDASHRSGVLRTSESVFDPATRTVTPVSQYPGLAGAATGIDATVQEGKHTGAFVIRPGDGSTGITVPIEPGSVSFPLEGEKPDPFNSGEDLIFLNAPGITLMALDPDRKIWTGGYGYTHTYRLYGAAGGSA